MTFTSLQKNTQQKKSRGFTLIELLVVIAIIGILSSIVLASLSGPRDRAKDTAIQAMVSQIRSAAEVYYVDSYGDASESFCDEIAGTLKAAIEKRGGDDVAYGCNASGNTYTANATLSTGSVFCVDSSGFADVLEGAVASVGVSCK